jgi:hypothetical protein
MAPAKILWEEFLFEELEGDPRDGNEVCEGK